MKKVSILVRTCGRPEVLANCLKSIRNQTYNNIETIVVEDGANVSQSLIENKFSDMDLKYYSTGRRVGRAVAGNIAMEKAAGDYLNFLDDDDEFYPDHVETLVNELEGSSLGAVYSVAEELVCRYNSGKKGYINIKKKIRFRQKFNRMQLYFANYLPIQTVMFDKRLFTEMGGFRENVDYLEDWDLWVRYSTAADFKLVDRVTSFYRVPLFSVKRDMNLRIARKQIDSFFSEYNLSCNVGECSREINEMVKSQFTSPLKRKIYKIGSSLLQKRAK